MPVTSPALPTRNPRHVACAIARVNAALEDLLPLRASLGDDPAAESLDAVLDDLAAIEERLAPWRTAETAQVATADRAGLEYAHTAVLTFAAAAARAAAYGDNYVEMTCTDEVEGRLVVTVQRAGKVTPAEGRRAAEEHALALAARLAALGHDPGPLPATFAPPPERPLGPPAFLPPGPPAEEAARAAARQDGTRCSEPTTPAPPWPSCALTGEEGYAECYGLAERVADHDPPPWAPPTAARDLSLVLPTCTAGAAQA